MASNWSPNTFFCGKSLGKWFSLQFKSFCTSTVVWLSNASSLLHWCRTTDSVLAAGIEIVCVDRVAGASFGTGFLLACGCTKEFNDASSGAVCDGVASVSFGSPLAGKQNRIEFL